MAACVRDLEKHGRLIRITEQVDPDLEIAEIHRRVFERQGPALLFERVKGSPFRAVSNIYGTYERTEWLFRHTLKNVQKVIELKADPGRLVKNPFRYVSAPFTASTSLPMRSRLGAPVTYGTTTIDQLPLVKSWPMDGGAFVTLPQVYTEDPDQLGIMNSNIGMYRVQLTGNDYIPNKEIGLHYQLHRGIGVHHTKYNEIDEPFRVSVFVGGPPSHAFAAIMPLPEGLPEVLFAGMLGGRRFRYTKRNGFTLSSDADFVITGTVQKGVKKPEGPFGDHLGYYSLQHDFPVMTVDNVWHRKNPIWHFSVVGRPPAEDSSFGYLIHQIVKELAPQEFPGLVELNAVDAAGVHPLLLAIGQERYMPFRERVPEEILTIAMRVLGSGQTSLAKYLFIAASDDDPTLDTHDIPRFFDHLLRRVDWTRDLHFTTKTTIDTLDYSGSGWNSGSKLIIACRGDERRTLDSEIPEQLSLPNGFGNPRMIQPGIMAVEGPKYGQTEAARAEVETLCRALSGQPLDGVPMIILTDDAPFAAATVNNFVWTTFTRSNPSHDLFGVDAFVENKHWGARGPIVIDARVKPHHAPGLVEDPEVTKRADRFFKKGGVLEKWG